MWHHSPIFPYPSRPSLTVPAHHTFLSHRSFDSWDRGSQRVEGVCCLAMSYCLSASRNGKQTLNYSESLNIF